MDDDLIPAPDKYEQLATKLKEIAKQGATQGIVGDTPSAQANNIDIFISQLKDATTSKNISDALSGLQSEVPALAKDYAQLCNTVLESELSGKATKEDLSNAITNVRTGRSLGSLKKEITTALGKDMSPEQIQAAEKFHSDLVSVNQGNVGNLDKSFEALQQATGLEKSAIAKLALDATNAVYPGDKGKKDLVNEGIGKQLDKSEPVVEKPKTDPEKATELAGKITKELQTALGGKELTEQQKEFVGVISANVVNPDRREQAVGINVLMDTMLQQTGLKSYQIGPVVDLISQYHPQPSDQATFVGEKITTFQAAHENDKRLDLQQGITKELEKSIGKPLDSAQLQEVNLLVGDVVRADKNGLGMDKLLDSLANATGLKSYQIGPVVDMVSKFHDKGTPGATFVGEGVGKFLETHAKENSDYLDKISKLTVDFNTSLEKAMGKPMTEAQKDASAKFVMNYTEANKGQLGPAMEELTKATGLTTGAVLDSVNSNLYSFHKDSNQIKHDLVIDELAPFFDAAEKQQPLVEKAGRDLDQAVETALKRPMTDKERNAASQFLVDLVSVNEDNVGNLDRSCKDLQQATGLSLEQIKEFANGVVGTVHPGDEGTKELVKDRIEILEMQESLDKLKRTDTELAQDSFIAPSKSGQGKSLATSGQNKDEIIEAIRKEVIEKQNAFLIDRIAERLDLPIPQQQAFKNQLNTPDKMREYLESDEGRKRVDMAMKEKAVQNGLAKIESTGYSKVHDQFEKSYRDVAWKQETGSKTRVSEVTNANGEKVASIKETTHDTAPTKVKLSDGTEKTIRSYREIEFPKTVDKGPAHFSMALKDENGRNMPEKDAVYFTAHYDDSGKLMEVSSPKPVKFAGTGPDAIGYIERDGQVLTLPVTREKYNEMMQEVAINNGRSTTVDRGVEQAVDSVAVGSKEQPTRARENQVDEPTVTGRPRGKEVSERDRPVINPLSGQVVDPQVAKKAAKLKDGLENPTPKTPAPKEQHGRPRSQSMPPPKPKSPPKEGMAMQLIHFQVFLQSPRMLFIVIPDQILDLKNVEFTAALRWILHQVQDDYRTFSE